MSARVTGPPSRPRRRGAALPIALVLLAVGTALAIGTAAGMRASTRDSRGAAAIVRARAAATGALAVTLRRWQPSWATSLPIGAVRRTPVAGPDGDVTVTVLRLDTARYLLTAAAGARTGAAGTYRQAARHVGVFVQLQRPWLQPPAALVSGGPVAAPPGVRLRGVDGAPDGWTNCPAAAAGVADLAIAHPADSVAVHPDALATRSVVLTPAARDDVTYEVFGDVRWDALARRADVVVPAGGMVAPLPRADAGTCARDGASWGEPRRGTGSVGACTDAFPVVHVRGAGATRLRGPARMQGILLVDGDLDVDGDVEITGVVLVRGALRAPAASLRVTGALLVRQRATPPAGPNTVALGAGSVVAYSQCAVTTVTLAASQPIALGRRAWVDVTR